MPPRILVVYYSRTGRTQRLAEQIAATLGADLEPITERRHRRGVRGLVRSLFQALRRRAPEIDPSLHDPASYDLVIVGTPIWASSVSSPVRTYLRRHRAAVRRVAWFCTCIGSGGDQAFVEMTRDLGHEPAATLIVRASELAHATPAIDAFLTALGPAFGPARPATST